MAPTVWRTSFGNEQQMESGEKQLCCEQQRSVKIPLDTRPNPLERNSQLGLAVSNMPGQPSVRHSGCVSLDSISLPLTSDHQDKHYCSYPLLPWSPHTIFSLISFVVIFIIKKKEKAIILFLLVCLFQVLHAPVSW